MTLPESSISKVRSALEFSRDHSGNYYEVERRAKEALTALAAPPVPVGGLPEGFEDAIAFIKANRHTRGFESAGTMLDGLLTARAILARDGVEGKA